MELQSVVKPLPISYECYWFPLITITPDITSHDHRGGFSCNPSTGIYPAAMPEGDLIPVGRPEKVHMDNA